MNWPIQLFEGKTFTNCQEYLMINGFSKHFEGKIFMNGY